MWTKNVIMYHCAAANMSRDRVAYPVVFAAVILSPEFPEPRIHFLMLESQSRKVLVEAWERRVQGLNRERTLQHDRLRVLGLTLIRPRIAAQPNESRADAHSPRRFQYT